MKIPTPQKLPSGSWRIQLRLGGDSVSVTRPTERECIRAAELIKAEHRAGKRQTAGKTMTLSEAIDRYIADRDAVLSPATIRGYRIIQKNRFPSMMHRPLTGDGWQRAVNAESAQVAPKTLLNAYRFIASVLRDNGITAPAVKLPQAVRSERDWLRPEEITVFLDQIRDEPVELCALLALHSLRRSEIFALEKKDIDLRRGVIHVRGSVVPDENNRYVKKATNKTLSSARDVPIMIPRLRELVESAPDGPLVTEHPDIPRRQIKRACLACGFQPVTLHGLRHSFASLAYHLGLSELETMRLGGWSDPGTMRKIYTHLSEQDALDATRKLSGFFENAHEN